jgi:hypothetical protein
MAYVLMTDRVTGRVAVYEENGTGGAADDPNASRNAPLNNPNTHLSKVRFHSDWDYYQVHSMTLGIPITHASVAGASVVVCNRPTITRQGQIVRTDINLLAHGLGYAPAYMIVSDDCLIGPSSLLQVTAAGHRFISPYANTTHICLYDVGVSGASTLASLAKTYDVIVFRAPVEDSPYLFDYNKAADELIMGYGKFRGSLKALRSTLIGDASPFDIPLGRTVDIKNGFGRTVLADGTVYDMPGYNGSFAGSPSIQCTVE